MTPRSFLLAERQARQQQKRQHNHTGNHNQRQQPSSSPRHPHPPSVASPPAPSINTCTSSTSSFIDAPTPFIPYPYSPSIPEIHNPSSSPPPFPSSLFTPDSYPPAFLSTSASSTVTTTSTTSASICWSPNYDDRRTSNKIDDNIHSRITTVPPEINATMGKRKDRRETSCLSPSSPPKATTGLTMRPTTPTSPVKIPTNSNNNNRFVAHPQKRHTSQRRRPRDSRSTDNLSPSLAALLAVTDIPRPKQARHRRRSDKTMTVEAVIDCQQGCEKELSWSLSKNPMQILLSPPQDVADDDDSVSDCNIGSAMSTRTYSIDSIPSLDDSFSSDGLSSLGSPRTPSPLARRTRFTPMRKSLEPVISPPGSVDEHPLAISDSDAVRLDLKTDRRGLNDCSE